MRMTPDDRRDRTDPRVGRIQRLTLLIGLALLLSLALGVVFGVASGLLNLPGP